MELSGDRVLHGYHCTCPECGYDPQYNHTIWPLRVQRDSTCSGEVISRPFAIIDEEHEWLNVMEQLQRAAVNQDAEPGLNAGFHVHVRPMLADGRTGRTGMRSRVLWAFLLWEPTLLSMAAGRFQSVRDMNVPVRESLNYYLQRHQRDFVRSNWSEGTYMDFNAMSRTLRGDDLRYFLQGLYEHHAESDRHSNLNVVTNHDTIEFRLWNSTRSAWRMELFVRLSAALCDLSVANEMAATAPSTENMASILRNNGYEQADELLSRQLAYARDGALTAPSVLTGL